MLYNTTLLPTKGFSKIPLMSPPLSGSKLLLPFAAEFDRYALLSLRSLRAYRGELTASRGGMLRSLRDTPHIPRRT